jgi:hypothetical protein
MFTAEEKKELLNRLPAALELSYEPKLHKKVYSPYYSIIPKGPKALVWYTYWKEDHICLLIKLNERGNYSDVQPFTSVFSDQLALGTIIYGTYFLHYNRHYFTCEQLYFYQGLNVSKKPQVERLELLLGMFTNHVDQIAYTLSSLIVGLPIMTETYEEALAELDQQPYKTYGITGVHVKRSEPLQVKRSEPQVKRDIVKHDTVKRSEPLVKHDGVKHDGVKRDIVKHDMVKRSEPQVKHNEHANQLTKAIFNVKASLAADNYQLYTADNILYETAMIPTYKCSVMMNALFRNIKENANLDLLEESDDEAEFENTQMDKFVDLEKTVRMECVYSKRFRKWQPVKAILIK